MVFINMKKYSFAIILTADKHNTSVNFYRKIKS